MTSFTYDDWGRRSTKTLPNGTVKTNSWGIAKRLTKVDSDFPGGGLVTYDYGGNGDPRSGTFGGER